MADELTLAFTLPGRDADVHAAWRAQPPAFLSDGGYERKDESYDTLVYEADVIAKGTRAADVRHGDDPLPAVGHVQARRRAAGRA